VDWRLPKNKSRPTLKTCDGHRATTGDGTPRVGIIGDGTAGIIGDRTRGTSGDGTDGIGGTSGNGTRGIDGIAGNALLSG